MPVRYEGGVGTVRLQELAAPAGVVHAPLPSRYCVAVPLSLRKRPCAVVEASLVVTSLRPSLASVILPSITLALSAGVASLYVRSIVAVSTSIAPMASCACSSV